MTDKNDYEFGLGKVDYVRFLDKVWPSIKNELLEMQKGVGESLVAERDNNEIFRFQGRGEVLRDIVIHFEVTIPDLLELEDDEEAMEPTNVI